MTDAPIERVPMSEPPTWGRTWGRWLALWALRCLAVAGCGLLAGALVLWALTAYGTYRTYALDRPLRPGESAVLDALYWPIRLDPSTCAAAVLILVCAHLARSWRTAWSLPAAEGADFWRFGY